jgi:CRISPR/Cas system CMR-associated protein Cmr5 small subunit
MQTLDQRIAKAAHHQILELRQANPERQITSDACGHIKKTAARLRTAGLGITITFCLKNANKKDLAPIAEALAACLKELPGVDAIRTAEDLQQRYLDADMREVRLLTTYAEQALEWLGRWADSYKTDKK